MRCNQSQLWIAVCDLCYCPGSDTWYDAGEIAVARAVLPCAVWNGMAVIVNGEQRPGKRSNQVWGAKM